MALQRLRRAATPHHDSFIATETRDCACSDFVGRGCIHPIDDRRPCPRHKRKGTTRQRTAVLHADDLSHAQLCVALRGSNCCLRGVRSLLLARSAAASEAPFMTLIPNPTSPNSRQALPHEHLSPLQQQTNRRRKGWRRGRGDTDLPSGIAARIELHVVRRRSFGIYCRCLP